MIKKTLEIGGQTLSIEMGRVAKQADGAALVRYGDTVVLATACASNEPREGISFLPLTVDYREWTYAAGKIPGGFFKREGRPNQKETLTCRLIDRPIRPLFPEGWACETQVIGMVLSSDQKNDSDVLAVCGAGASLYCSDIPFPTPIAAVRVGRVDRVGRACCKQVVACPHQGRDAHGHFPLPERLGRLGAAGLRLRSCRT